MEAQALAAFGSMALTPNPASTSVRPPARTPVSVEQQRSIGATDAEKSLLKEEDKNAKADEPSDEDIKDAAKVLNGVMSELRTNVKFSLHEATKIMMVQIVDARDQRVIKEIPPKEFLDMMAKLRDLAGAIFDRQA